MAKRYDDVEAYRNYLNDVAPHSPDDHVEDRAPEPGDERLFCMAVVKTTFLFIAVMAFVWLFADAASNCIH